jgi:hypothetical protein
MVSAIVVSSPRRDSKARFLSTAPDTMHLYSDNGLIDSHFHAPGNYTYFIKSHDVVRRPAMQRYPTLKTHCGGMRVALSTSRDDW